MPARIEALQQYLYVPLDTKRMKHLLSFLLFPFFLQAQSDTINEYWHAGDKKEPTAKEVLLKVTVYNLARNKMANAGVQVVQTETGRVWRGITGKFGEVLFLVPKGKEYRVDVGNETGIQTLTVSNEKYARENLGITWLPDKFTEDTRNDSIFQKVSPAQTPTRSRLLVHLTVLDLDNKPLDGEEMYFAAEKAGKVYVAQTNRAGKAYVMLPMGDKYCVSTRFQANLKCYELPQDERAGQLNITYNTIGAKAILRRKAERERLAAIRDSLYEVQRIQDSIALARAARQKNDNFLHQLEFGQNSAEVRKKIEKRAAEERDSIARDPLYFEKNGEAVKATLYRMRDRWKNKVVVTDLTCSMSPYMDQILLWHALRLTQGEENRYIFFNDGDGKTQEQKIVGQTGGFHFTEQADMIKLIETMLETTRYGCSGDGPENDLEALLEGATKRKGLDELILVADNYSDVRDIELLTRLNVPVHIILCGAEYGVNEEYLEIAYRTRGSVHTIEEDIDNLAELADGATITIGQAQYRVSRGKFIQVSRI